MTQPLAHSYGQMDAAYAARGRNLAPEEDGHVWMVNLMAYKKKAVYEGVEAEIDGKEADNRYNPIDVLMKIGADMSFVSDVVDQSADTEPLWDRIAVVRYPTRRSFIEMGDRKDFREKHKHKQAGMDQTIVCPCLPIGESSDAAAELPADGSPEAIVSLHLVRFAEGSAEGRADYANACAAAVSKHGGSTEALLEVEGTFLGDGRSWDLALMFRFPTLEAYTASAAELTSGALGDAVADRYDVATRPMIDRMRASLQV